MSAEPAVSVGLGSPSRRYRAPPSPPRRRRMSRTSEGGPEQAKLGRTEPISQHNRSGDCRRHSYCRKVLRQESGFASAGTDVLRRKGRAVMAERLRAVRRIWPPPSPCEPSRLRISIVSARRALNGLQTGVAAAEQRAAALLLSVQIVDFLGEK